MPGDLEPRSRPTVSAPSSRVTIAFPFSNIKVDDASDELRRLAAIVVALTERFVALQPSPETEDIARQARELLTKLA